MDTTTEGEADEIRLTYLNMALTPWRLVEVLMADMNVSEAEARDMVADLVETQHDENAS